METNLIGRAIEDARLRNGFSTRSELVNQPKLKGKLTQEGLRKIEQGARVPRLETLQLLAKVLGLTKATVRPLERAALRTNIMRAVKRSGNATVSFRIDGEPVKMFALPPKRKTEQFVRSVVTSMLAKLEKYGLSEEDMGRIRMELREVLHSRLNP